MMVHIVRSRSVPSRFHGATFHGEITVESAITMIDDIVYYCDNKRHLVCTPYTIENLHRMATDLGIKRCWFHSGASYPHYDIPKRRINEITEKCTLVSSYVILSIVKEVSTDAR
jgi:hypothetical protein